MRFGRVVFLTVIGLIVLSSFVSAGSFWNLFKGCGSTRLYTDPACGGDCPERCIESVSKGSEGKSCYTCAERGCPKGMTLDKSVYDNCHPELRKRDTHSEEGVGWHELVYCYGCDGNCKEGEYLSKMDCYSGKCSTAGLTGAMTCVPTDSTYSRTGKSEDTNNCWSCVCAPGAYSSLEKCKSLCGGRCENQDGCYQCQICGQDHIAAEENCRARCDGECLFTGANSCFTCAPCSEGTHKKELCEQSCSGECVTADEKGMCFKCVEPPKPICPEGTSSKEACEESCKKATPPGKCISDAKVKSCYSCKQTPITETPKPCPEGSANIKLCELACDGFCASLQDRAECARCIRFETQKKCPEGSVDMAKCKQACSGSCVPLTERKDCAQCMRTETPPPCPEASVHILACKQGCEGSCVSLKERSDCAVCMRTETPPPCPEGSTHILACKQSCDGSCTPLRERSDCAQCVRSEAPPTSPPPCPEGTIAGASCLQSCNGYCAAHPERKDCARCMSCSEWCSWKGYSTTPLDHSSYILSYLNQYECVSGASIQYPGGVRSERCTCYSTEKPTITVDTRPPMCQTPCGEVKCGSSTTCSCGERCTMTATCNWGGWKQTGQNSFGVQVGSSSSQSDAPPTGQAVRTFPLTGNVIRIHPSGKFWYGS